MDKYLKSSTIKGEKSLTSYTRLRKTSITQDSLKINTTTNKSSASAVVLWAETKIFLYPVVNQTKIWQMISTISLLRRYRKSELT